MNKNTFIASIFFLSLSTITHAKEASLVRHVILNNTTDSVRYDFKNKEDNGCHISGTILPGQFKDLNCKDAKATSYSTYAISFTAFYTSGWLGSITNRCSGVLDYDVENDKIFNDKQLVWTINAPCVAEVTEI